MGAYIYMLRSPKLLRKVRVKLNDGTENIVEAGIIDFLFKPYRFGDDSPFDPMPCWERLCVATMARMEKIWDKFGKRPNYVVLTHTPDGQKRKMKVGETVLFWPNGVPVWSWDTPCFEGSTNMGTVVELL
jgi:hypothetical protein